MEPTTNENKKGKISSWVFTLINVATCAFFAGGIYFIFLAASHDPTAPKVLGLNRNLTDGIVFWMLAVAVFVGKIYLQDKYGVRQPEIEKFEEINLPEKYTGREARKLH